MNNKLLLTIKRACLSAYRDIVQEPISMTKDGKYIIINNKRQVFDYKMVQQLNNEISETFNEQLNSKDKTVH